MNALSQEEVMSRLHEVVDPCSAATRVPLSIVEMGMVEKVEFASGRVFVALRMTSPLCHALPYFEMEIERLLAGIPGFVGVKCTFDHGGNWEPGNMTTGAQQKLADQREFVRSRAGENASKGYHTLKRVDVLMSPSTA
jgi:metal-sulfur cluster biosynthetic enzyme